jgi:antitoxin ParD1/3/4
MPRRAISSDKVLKPSLPFAQATEVGGFVFACSTERVVEGRLALGNAHAQTQQTIRDETRREAGRQKLRRLLLDGAESGPGTLADEAYFVALREIARGRRTR